MIDLDRLRNARDADYETGIHLCKEGAAEIERLREIKTMSREGAKAFLLATPKQELEETILRLTRERDEARQFLWLLVHSFSGETMELTPEEIQAWPGPDKAMFEQRSMPNGIVRLRAYGQEGK
jgi:hypothetical protein